ncbi:syntaxin-binding protein 5-like isoform X7 [Macrosteles quadrilineatus]|uniref:syntaxin-binding protein 5-like isoform X7 n=1 Tax=Macrosteles quadrilineatus TaxID=74068 RepID=UPI0023E2513A|nr:syntaxin-binding protein 5-like isoform X7 [Macrosteles quadrilineatus]XP_054272387.1 syntaxin-binding protein 5-like isoform X7 [Macrosteles quadrilineatus]
MKKFTFQRVLDGLRSSVSQQPRPEQEIVETLRPDNFQVTKTFRHGFPYQPTAVAFDPVQHLLAIGTKTGSLRLLGRPGVDSHVRHETDAAVVQIVFLMNEGALVTATADDSLHLWNFRQKRPEVVHSLKFQRERITFMHLPLQSKWLYVGSERGNIHVVNIESFVLSGYVINWNKAIEVCRKTHPGPVIHLSDNPLDPSKLLIGYESGQLVLWDLRTRTAELRWHSAEPLKSVTWHHEGKQFMCSHTDGSLTTWNVRASPKPLNVSFPHAKTNKDGKLETCKPIQKVEWKSSRSGEAYVIFSGGLTYDKAGRTPSITVIHGKTTTVLEMEHNVVDFITLCESPWVSDMQEPYAIVVLLHNDLVVIDLLSQGFPCFENPYPMDLHESAVTCCTYLADCPSDLIPAFYSVGSRTQKRTGFSEREWPISGGEWSPTSCSYNEIILTGHADGSIKFWDASAGTLQVLYKLKTSKVFEKPRTKSVDGSAEEDPFAIQLISLCPESRKLCIAGASSYVILFKFRKLESVGDTCTLEIPVVYEVSEEPEVSPECEYPPKPSLTDPDNKKSSLEYTLPVKVKPGPIKKPPGFQAHLVCITPVANGDSPSSITALCINSSYGLMAYGNEVGLVVVDIVQKCCLLSIGTPDLYGNADPYQRVPRSPKRNPLCEGDGERCRSPSIDQINGVCVSPTGKLSGSPARRAVPEPVRRSKSQDKLDSSFSRSRSSSMSSLENISSEAIQCLSFADSYTKKSEASTFPTLWVGTSLGSVLTVMLNVPAPGETRLSQPVAVSPCGTIFRLKGCILTMSFLDCNGALIPYSYESWKDEGKQNVLGTPTRSSTNNSRMSPPLGGSEMTCDRQFVVLVSEKQARVVALPSQNCVYRQQLADTDFVVKAEIISLKDSVCLVCYISSGHITAYSLPSLRPLIDVDFLPLPDLSFQTRKQGIVDPMLSIWGQQMFVNEDTDQIARTFCFSNRGHGLFLSSPSEVQKFTVSAEFCSSLVEMVGELFLPHDMPEPPKQSFFQGLFGGGSRNLDREELFGESSGRASRSVAKHIPGPSAQIQELNQRATSASSEVSRAHQLMVERGAKLGQLEERTERMMGEAENFQTSAHSLMLKYKDKKWYQL